MTAVPYRRQSNRPGPLGKVLGLLAIGLMACAAPQDAAGQDSSDSSSSALATARQLVDAFNRHDPAAMAALVSDGFELYYVNSEGAAELALVGPEPLAAEMESYFVSRPSVRSEIVSEIEGETFVAFREQIVGGQSSLAVYEVHDGLIHRAWYYPAEDPPASPES